MPKALYIPPEVLRAIAKHVDQAVAKAVEGYLSAHEDEDTLTGHLGANLRTGTHTVDVRDPEQGVGQWKWRIDYRKFRGRGPLATEAFLGADGIFELMLFRGREERIKSLLFQAKKELSSDPALVPQIIRLSTWREAAFVLNYTANAFEALSIDDLIASRGNRARVAHSEPLNSFLSNRFLPCLIGDTELHYDAIRRRLSWRAMNGQLVATDFTVGHRIRFDVKAPKSQTIDPHKLVMLGVDTIHDYRMKAEYEDILGVSMHSSDKEKTQARNKLV